MVSLKVIRASNALINDGTAPRVAVFVGGTSGIGKLTIRALVATGASMRIYLVGRKSSEERSRAFIQELQAINAKAEVIWTEGEVVLLAETKRVCQIIKEKEQRIDLLVMSTGYAPFGSRQETAEGIEIAQSLEYYTRMLFIQHLLPLLRAAEAPRVVNVLGGGMEWNINVDDMDLRKPGNFGGFWAQMQYVSMTTAALEKLANENPHLTFIHSCPGWVDTGNVRRATSPGSVVDWLLRIFIEPIIHVFSFSDDESAQRHLFQSTSAAFGGRGVTWKGKPGVNSLGEEADGLFLVNQRCDCVRNARVVSFLREHQGKVWDHTEEILRPYM